MQTRRVLGVFLVSGCLAFMSGCDDDIYFVEGGGGAPAVPTATRPAATATKTATQVVQQPTATATTVVQPATPTPTEVEQEGTPTPTEVEEVATPTPTTPAGEGLGIRELTVKKPRSAFNSSALGGLDVSTNWSSGPIKLKAGAQGDGGIATVELAEDAIFGLGTLGNSVACFKLLAEGSHGTIDCDGGSSASFTFSQDSHGFDPEDPSATITQGIGDSGAGAVVLYVRQQQADVVGTTNPAVCATTELFQDPIDTVYGTGSVTGVIQNPSQQEEDIMISGSGENFDCASWTTTDGAGGLASVVLGFDDDRCGSCDAAQTLLAFDN